jgi:translation initiation factor IF-2
MMELKANPEALASGVIVEAKKSTKSGAVATVLVQNGTLRVQDIVISGLHFAKVRAMINDRGEPIKEAGPSSAAKILGLSGIPEVGDSFYVVENEKKVKSIIDKRRKQKRENKLAAFSKKITLEDITEQIQKGQVKTLKVILKTDVQGSLEAITSSLEQIKSEEVKLDIIHQSAGSVNESDVMLALASSALIIGFGVGVESKASQIAKSKGIEIKLYSIIYELISDVKAVMSGLLEPQVKRTFMGRADVRQVFDISKLGMVAGCMVTKGTIIRGEEVQVKRNDEVIYNGRVDSLKRFKNDVKEVKEGFECGIGFDNFNNIKVGDTIEVFRVEKIKRTLL